MTYNENIKRNQYKWNANNPEKYAIQSRKNVKAFYNRNKDLIKEKNSARYRFGTEFFSYIKISNNLNELQE